MRYKSRLGHTARPASDPVDSYGCYRWDTLRMVYPLTAVCTCGEIITRKDQHSPWTHS